MTCKYPTAEHRNYFVDLDCFFFDMPFGLCCAEDSCDDCEDGILKEGPLKRNINYHMEKCSREHGFPVGYVIDYCASANKSPISRELSLISRYWVVCSSTFDECTNIFSMHPLNAEDGFMSGNEWNELYS